MKSYYQALDAATVLVNMPNPQTYPGKYIQWAEDICELIGSIYDRSFDQVSEDLSEALGLLEE